MIRQQEPREDKFNTDNQNGVSLLFFGNKKFFRRNFESEVPAFCFQIFVSGMRNR
jgi:hypothetical protein